MTRALISADDLHAGLEEPGLVLLDASYGLPPSPFYIGDAQPFDIDAVADLSAPLPHTLPAPDIFAAHVGRLGISNDDTVIVYDRAGIHMAAARAWWMFRAFGHNNVRILDGGLPAWIARGMPVAQKAPASPQPKKFEARFRPELFKTGQEMLENITARRFTVLDARDGGRFSGLAPEPRPGIEPGHIPGSANLPFAQLIDPATGKMRKKADLEKIFASARADLSKPIACTCGSGVTACVIALALFETGRDDAAIYGGSWTEWGSNKDLPKAKGSA